MSQPVTEEAFKSLEFERHTVARERNPGFELTWASVGGVIIASKPVPYSLFLALGQVIQHTLGPHTPFHPRPSLGSFSG